MSAATPAHLEGLTTAQRRAAEHEAGPILVLAGPGTGKTRVIAHRVAHLVTPREGGGRGAEPESVLALTFSVKAAEEMRERIAGMVGASVAERISVHTFHALGQRLVARFADLLGMPRQPRVIDSAERRRLLRQVLGEHDLLPESAGLGREGVIAEAERVIEALWNHAIEPERRAEFLARARADLEAAGDPETPETQSRRLTLRRFEDFGRLADLLEAACRRRGWVSMSELLTLPARLLRRSALASSVVRAQWRHVIVDEWQDVNTAQIELLRGIAPPAGEAGTPPPGPDLCVVGDDDQAIYEFRGADDRAFTKFARVWRGHAEVTLAENFRSDASIVAVANDVISRAPDGSRFRPGKSIIAAKAAGAEAPGPAGVEAVKLEHEHDDADVIAAMIAAEARRRPGMNLGTIAVIARTRSDLARIAAGLEIEGIPFRIRDREGALDDDGVQDVLAWMELLVNPEATWAARRVMLRPPMALDPNAVTAWEQHYRAARSRVDNGIAPAPAMPAGGYAAWLRERAREPGMDAATRSGLERFASLHGRLSADAASRRAEEVIHRIILDADPAHADVLSGIERTARVAALVSLLRLARERQDRLPAPGDLRAFWAYFNDLDEDERLGGSDPTLRIDRPADGGEGEEEHAVHLLTAHSAKGLEFDTVFVPRVNPPNGYPTSKSSDEVLPEGLVDRAGDTRSARQRKEAEERRLFYVACTRAERRLILLAKWNKSRSRSTHYFEELVRDRTGGPAIRTMTAAEALAAAAVAGASRRDDLDQTGRDLVRMAARREAVALARRSAREDAADALARAARPDASAADLDATAAVMRDAACRLAIAAAAERDAPAPAWIADRPDWRDLDRRLRAGEIAPAALRVPMRAPRPPLRLSYQLISDYQRCPRCWYVKHQLGLPESLGAEVNFGSAVHTALERFYKEWTDADNADSPTPRPGVERLVALGRECLAALTPLEVEVDRASLRQVEAQLRQTHRLLHDERMHVLEMERAITWPYTLDGREHTFTAKIDRIDLLPAPPGARRIVDYKTGAPRAALLEPARDDLQLGIYAMALASTLHDEPLTGVAEYWVLSTGERGSIRLEDLALDKVREAINEAARGILAGNYPRGKKCSGACAILGP